MKRRILGSVLLLGLCACSLLEPQPNRTRYFVLETTAAGATTAAPPRSASRAIGVGPVRLPDYLRRVEIVRRISGNQLRISDDEQWGESLDLGVGRVLAEDLGIRLNSPAVVRLPGVTNLPLDLEVPIEVVSFEADDQGSVRLVARWALKPARGGRVSVARESRIVEAVNGRGTGAAIAAMSRAIEGLGAEIAAAIDALDVKKTGAGG